MSKFTTNSKIFQTIMKRSILIVFLLSLTLISCVGDDFIDDRVDERISINNPISEIQVNDSYQLEATFFNNIGQPETISLNWSSSDESIATVSSQGLLTGISLGDVVIRISATLSDGTAIEESQMISVLTQVDGNDNLVTKSGVIVTTSSYVLTGDFSISEIQNSQNLDLQIAENYQASTSLPGLYLYLSNNPNSINGALEVGPVSIFSGAHSYELENVGINDYQYLLYWCKPFSVKVGDGEITD